MKILFTKCMAYVNEEVSVLGTNNYKTLISMKFQTTEIWSYKVYHIVLLDTNKFGQTVIITCHM